MGRRAGGSKASGRIVRLQVRRAKGMFVNDKAVEPSGRQLHEGDCMRIGMKTEVRVIRLPKDGDDVMVLNVTDRHGTREEKVRLPMVDEDAARDIAAYTIGDFRGKCLISGLLRGGACRV